MAMIKIAVHRIALLTLFNGVKKVTFSPYNLLSFVWLVPKNPTPSHNISDKPYNLCLNVSFPELSVSLIDFR